MKVCALILKQLVVFIRANPGKKETTDGSGSDVNFIGIGALFRCHVKMGTPQNGDPGSPYSREYRDPSPHFLGSMGTRDPHISGKMGIPWPSTITGMD